MHRGQERERWSRSRIFLLLNPKDITDQQETFFYSFLFYNKNKRLPLTWFSTVRWTIRSTFLSFSVRKNKINYTFPASVQIDLTESINLVNSKLQAILNFQAYIFIIYYGYCQESTNHGQICYFSLKSDTYSFCTTVSLDFQVQALWGFDWNHFYLYSQRH